VKSDGCHNGVLGKSSGNNPKVEKLAGYVWDRLRSGRRAGTGRGATSFELVDKVKVKGVPRGNKVHLDIRRQVKGGGIETENRSVLQNQTQSW